MIQTRAIHELPHLMYFDYEKGGDYTDKKTRSFGYCDGCHQRTGDY
jgi:hypothetical protein